MNLDKRGLGPQLKDGQEMDGGVIEIRGQRMRVILDNLGRFKRHAPIDPDAPAAPTTAMDKATEEARRGAPPAGAKPKGGKPKAGQEGAQAGEEGEQGGAQAGGEGDAQGGQESQEGGEGGEGGFRLPM